MSSIRRNRPGVSVAYLAGFLGALGLLVLGATVVSHSLTREETLARARKLVDRGFFTLASRILEPYSDSLTKNADGCQLLIASFYGARRMATINRITQACAMRGFGSTEGVLGSAEVYEAQGSLERAIMLLKFEARNYEKDGKLGQALASVLKRSGRIDEAAAAYLDAARGTPLERTDFSYEALAFFSEFALWKEARLMAGRLTPEALPDPERRLIAARALLRGGAPDDARMWVASVRTFLEQDPDSASALSGRYADVLGSDQGEAR